jgi:hypothetical protein
VGILLGLLAGGLINSRRGVPVDFFDVVGVTGSSLMGELNRLDELERKKISKVVGISAAQKTHLTGTPTRWSQTPLGFSRWSPPIF